MLMQKNTRKYRDLDLNFTRHPSTNDVSVRVDDQAIIRSLRNLIYMSNYEKPFHPEIGSSVRQMLFENFTPLTTQYLKNAIIEVITNFEPRVRINEVIVQGREDENKFEVILNFYIQNNAKPTIITLFLERTR